MSETNENKIDLVEKAVAEATGSKAVGRFARVAFEAAMNLRAGLSREQTSNAMLSHQANGRRMSARLPFGWKANRFGVCAPEGSQNVQGPDCADQRQMASRAYTQHIKQGREDLIQVKEC